jgi:hypothetical protein
MKLRYVGKSGQVKNGDVVEEIERISSISQTRAFHEPTGKIFCFRDDDLEPAFIYASDLPAGFLDALGAVRDQVTIRVHWPPNKDALVHMTFSENGLTLPEDARPLNNKQWDWSAEMRFPEIPANLTPDGTKAEAPGWLHNSRRDVVLAVRKAGFPLTDYAKFTKEEDSDLT